MSEPAPATSGSNPDQFRNLLAFFLVGAFISVLPLLVFRTIPTDNKEVIVYMIGQLSGMATMALGFYFTNKAGADALDAKRAETTGKMAEAITAAANSTPLGGDAGKAVDEVADAAADKADEIKGAATPQPDIKGD